MRFPPDFVEAYEESAAGRDARCACATPSRRRVGERSGWRFRAVEMDPAGHVNNSHYWVPLEEELAAGPEPETIDAEVEYRDPAMPGEAVLIREGSSMWVASRDGMVHASVLRVSP